MTTSVVEQLPLKKAKYAVFCGDEFDNRPGYRTRPMNGSVLDTNVITKLLDKDPAAIALVQRIENYFTSSIEVIINEQ